MIVYRFIVSERSGLSATPGRAVLLAACFERLLEASTSARQAF
jgi:hypothetical protein